MDLHIVCPPFFLEFGKKRKAESAPSTHNTEVADESNEKDEVKGWNVARVNEFWDEILDDEDNDEEAKKNLRKQKFRGVSLLTLDSPALQECGLTKGEADFVVSKLNGSFFFFFNLVWLKIVVTILKLN